MLLLTNQCCLTHPSNNSISAQIHRQPYTLPKEFVQAAWWRGALLRQFFCRLAGFFCCSCGLLLRELCAGSYIFLGPHGFIWLLYDSCSYPVAKSLLRNPPLWSRSQSEETIGLTKERADGRCGMAGWHGGWLQEGHVQVKDPPAGHGVWAPDSQTVSTIPLCTSRRWRVGWPGCNTNKFQAPLKYAEIISKSMAMRNACRSMALYFLCLQRSRLIGREMKGTVGK